MEFFFNFNSYLLLLIIFGVFIVINIFPIMFFLIPEIFILSVFGFCISGKISFIYGFGAMFFGSVIGETFSYYLGYRGINIDKYKNEKLNNFLIHLRKNEIKYLFIGKMLPFATRLVPVLSGIIKIKFYKFFIINTLMIVWGLLLSFVFLYFGNNFLDKYFLDYKYEIVLGIFIILFIILFAKLIYLFYKNRLGKNP